MHWDGFQTIDRRTLRLAKIAPNILDTDRCCLAAGRPMATVVSLLSFREPLCGCQPLCGCHTI